MEKVCVTEKGGCVSACDRVGDGQGARGGGVTNTLDHSKPEQMKDRRLRRRSIIVWKICLYSSMQNRRSIYNSSMYNHETHKMKDFISFP